MLAVQFTVSVYLTASHTARQSWDNISDGKARSDTGPHCIMPEVKLPADLVSGWRVQPPLQIWHIDEPCYRCQWVGDESERGNEM